MIRISLVLGITMLASVICYGDDYPNKPIRIVTGGVGGGSDFASRLVAQGLTRSFGASVVIDNRSSGVIPVEIVAQSSADGYTLLLFANALWIGPLMQKVRYDPAHDFAPLTLAVMAPNILVVHPSLPVYDRSRSSLLTPSQNPERSAIRRLPRVHPITSQLSCSKRWRTSI